MDKLQTVRFSSGRYSVATVAVGRLVEVMAMDNQVLVSQVGMRSRGTARGAEVVSIIDGHYGSAALTAGMSRSGP